MNATDVTQVQKKRISAFSPPLERIWLHSHPVYEKKKKKSGKAREDVGHAGDVIADHRPSREDEARADFSCSEKS